MNIENVINFLEERNLMESLSRKINYMNFTNFRKVLGKSNTANWLERIELFYTTQYYLNGHEFFKEELSTIYDEWDYIGTMSVSPIECFKEKPLTKTALIELLKKLPKEKIELLLRNLKVSEIDIQKILNQNEEISNQTITKIKKEKEIIELIKSIADMQTALGTMIHIMGDKISTSDIQNINQITKKATEYLDILKDEVKDLEQNPTLKLK
jgi:hypothetical protein